MSPPRLRRIHWALIGGARALVSVVVVARIASSRGFLGAPAPALVADLPAPPLSEASSIAAPLRLPLSTLVEELEQAVPTRFGSLDERIRLPDRQRASFAFQLTRSPFEVSL